MRTLIVTLLAALSITFTSASETPIADHLQEISVMILSPGGFSSSSGSGAIFTRTDSVGNEVNLIWTAAHVVDNLRSTRQVIAADGSKRTIVEFKDPKIVKEIRENGRTVGRLELDAEIIKYSDADNGHDLAVLRLRKQNFVQSTIEFYLEDDIPALGTKLYHVGSLLGQMGANSMTSGIYSQQGRLLNKFVFDQTTVAAFPGSSGGGVFLESGEYVGMLTRGAGETFNLIVPVRRIETWAKEANIEWAINRDVAMPSEAELRKIAVEDVGRDFSAMKSADALKMDKDFPFLLGGGTNSQEVLQWDRQFSID